MLRSLTPLGLEAASYELGRPMDEMGGTARGGAAHELFATVILSRFTADTWRLAPLAGPAPKKQSPYPGRFHVVQQDSTHETQAVLMTDSDVVNWLTAPTDSES